MEDTNIFPDNSTSTNDTLSLTPWNSSQQNASEFQIPIEMQFNEGHVVSIVTYSILIVFSAIGNITVLILIQQRKGKTRSRMNTMLMHLAIADLLVTFILMPTEIGWAITVAWKAGDAMCRIMMFFRIFGVYLSCFILVCISVDRYYAVLKPLHLVDVDRRGKVMLIIAWSASTLCSLPQMVVFHLETHPNVTWFEQCITFNAFPTPKHELMYSLFGMITMYVLPLFVIIYCYASIIAEIYKRSRESFSDKMRRSSLGFLGRAKIRTLKMTVIIISAFFACWTPYYVMCFWYWVDPASAKNVDQRIQKALFLFACTNSCMNPIVYGVFNIRSRKRDAGISQRAASCTSRAGLRSTVPDLVCKFSWRRSMNESNDLRMQSASGKTAPCRPPGFFSTNEQTPKIMAQKTEQGPNDGGQLVQPESSKRECFTITPQPRTTVI